MWDFFNSCLNNLVAFLLGGRCLSFELIGVRTVLVDEAPEVRQILMEILLRLGVKVVEFSTYSEFYAKVQSKELNIAEFDMLFLSANNVEDFKRHLNFVQISLIGSAISPHCYLTTNQAKDSIQDLIDESALSCSLIEKPFNSLNVIENLYRYLNKEKIFLTK